MTRPPADAVVLASAHTGSPGQAIGASGGAFGVSSGVVRVRSGAAPRDLRQVDRAKRTGSGAFAPRGEIDVTAQRTPTPGRTEDATGQNPEGAAREAVRATAEAAAMGFSLLAASLDAHAAEIRDPAATKALTDLRRRLEILIRATTRAADASDGRTVDVGALLRDTVMRHAIPAQDAGMTIDLSVCAGTAPVAMDIAIPILLVADELVRNALRYAFRGRASGLVRVELRLRGNNLLLSVRDDGIGISEKTLLSSGCGLGLMHELIQRIGGTVFIWREVGTAALVSVPLVAPLPDRRGAP
ncbi:MAG: ATP-binding protein [Rhodospirillales bacterium]|jgi:two-component sensor histidine kinase